MYTGFAFPSHPPTHVLSNYCAKQMTTIGHTSRHALYYRRLLLHDCINSYVVTAAMNDVLRASSATNPDVSRSSSAALFYLSALTNFRSKLQALGVPLVGLTTLPSRQSDELAAAAVVSTWVKACRAHIVITDETYDPVAMLQRTHMAKRVGGKGIQCPLYAIDSNFMVPVRNARNYLSPQQRHILASSPNNLMSGKTYKDMLNSTIRKIFDSNEWRQRMRLQPLSTAIQVHTSPYADGLSIDTRSLRSALSNRLCAIILMCQVCGVCACAFFWQQPLFAKGPLDMVFIPVQVTTISSRVDWNQVAQNCRLHVSSANRFRTRVISKSMFHSCSFQIARCTYYRGHFMNF